MRINRVLVRIYKNEKSRELNKPCITNSMNCNSCKEKNKYCPADTDMWNSEYAICTYITALEHKFPGQFSYWQQNNNSRQVSITLDSNTSVNDADYIISQLQKSYSR